ncbi:uncharacterized protein LOC135815596 [Sycon ciliatum]|uniref:uncharacterized protein LOC135815596 n=1 Tax=Sycon ciliatum TaxID=27933 RepID=UPI0031F67284
MDIVLKTTLWLFAFGFVAFLAGQENVSLPGYILVGLVILAIVSWLLSTFVTPFFERRHERELLEAVPEIPEEEKNQRRQELLERISAKQTEKAERFLARQSELQHEKLDSKDKQLNQFSPAWKGHGEAVVEPVRKRKGRSTDAESKPEISAVLESEPAADSTEVTTTFSVRMPKGDVQRRRFCTSSSILQVHAFVESCGYPPSRYSVFTLRPRQLVAVDENTLVSTLDPGRGLNLVVEERDDEENTEAEE